ncbi:MAG: sigma-70 family RNA polymerase sigma factor [Phycisphaerales bacterium]
MDTPSANARDTVTRLIRGMGEGDPGAAGALFEVVYDELRAIAGRQFSRERDGHTLQATALVHEAFLKLVDQPNVGELGRREFFGAASRAMRRILIDHARASKRLKRGGGQRHHGLDHDPPDETGLDQVDLLTLDEALDALAIEDERKSRLVELRFFGGLTMEQAGEVLGISRATADREWRVARAWLAARLRPDETGGGGHDG